MSIAEAERDAFARFPELARLAALRDTNRWTFIPRVVDGEVTEVRGVCTWPDGSADALLVRYTTDARALRVAPDGGVVWQKDGGLVEVIDRLFELPSPGSPNAPFLVVARSDPTLWTPRPSAS